MSGYKDSGWSRVPQDDAEAEFWPGHPGSGAYASGHATFPRLITLIGALVQIAVVGAIVGLVIGAIVGWATYRPDPNAWVDSRGLGLLTAAFVGVLIGGSFSCAVALIWVMSRRLTKRRTPEEIAIRDKREALAEIERRDTTC
jgi:NhaP-type Na+/H+ or K+/H+ antiporter